MICRENAMSLRKRVLVLSVLWVFIVSGCAGSSSRVRQHAGQTPPDSSFEEEKTVEIRDPLEPVNRAVFQFNDRLYFWGLKPAAQGYSAVAPKGVRTRVRNAFRNLSTPVRAVNGLLQADLSATGIEVSRFLVNTTIGLGGLNDPAREWGLKRQRKDLGQTLGVYGMGPVIYIVLPVLGPSSVRGVLGRAGDSFLEPTSYYPTNIWARGGVRTLEIVNSTSLRIGQYEEIKEQFAPYVALRNAYYQNRAYVIEEHGGR